MYDFNPLNRVKLSQKLHFYGFEIIIIARLFLEPEFDPLTALLLIFV